MTLYWVFFGAIIVCALFNWRRTVIAWIPFSMLFNEAICLKYTPPAVSFGLAVDSALLVLYYCIFRYRKSYRLVENRTTYFFKSIFIAYLISYGLSMLFSVVPFSQVLTGTIKYFIQSFVIVYLFQLSLQSKDDIKYFISCLLLSLVLVTFLGVLESFLKINPVLTYVYLNAPSSDVLFGKMYYDPIGLEDDSQVRYGMRRAFSFFSIHIAYGCACVMWYFFSLYISRKYQEHRTHKVNILIPLCICGVFLCNSKTPILGFIFFTAAFMKLDLKTNIKVVGVVLIGIVIIASFLPELINNFFAIFDSKVAAEGGGSSAEMRSKQFEVGFRLFRMNPIFGNGIGSNHFVMAEKYPDLLGSESSWLKILPQQGLLGAVVYLYMYITLFKRLKKIMGGKVSFLFLFGLLAMETATGFMEFTIWASIIIVIVKIHDLMSTKCRNYKII